MENEMKRGSIVLCPSPGLGHLVSMVELAKLLLLRHNLHVTVVVLDPPFNAKSITAFVSSVSAANPSISFHRLPPVDLSHYANSEHHEALQFELIRLSKPNLLSYLCSLPASLKAVVVDFFMTSAIDISKKLCVPMYVFFTSAAACLATFLHLPTLHSTTSQSFKDLGDSPIYVPGIMPIPANHMPLPLLDRDDDAYKGFLNQAIGMFDADGIIVNTFESLEQKAVQTIRDNGSAPPIYCVGPLVISERGEQQGDHCLAWLDTQPKAGVVFFCFGSLGRFSAEQLREIAVGLENSNQRFLWVVRAPYENYSADVDSLLPEGFLERTRGRGLVVKSWAPQVAVLAHEAVGGFVTHLGWNSVLEAISAGVGMIGWPLYAEQWMNKVFVVDDMKLALAMEGYDGEMVVAEEVERRVRELMESEVGGAVKKRCLAAKHAAEIALGEGGTSYVALDELVRGWESKRRG